ncbi:MAG TPA: hypothetical protein VFB02_04620 [Bradyrhizobium sp.]|nr:hypothetical protein [Bradyrhizobium sp.]
MLFGTLKGILITVAVSLVAMAYVVANPPVHVPLDKTLGRERMLFSLEQAAATTRRSTT